MQFKKISKEGKKMISNQMCRKKRHNKRERGTQTQKKIMQKFVSCLHENVLVRDTKSKKKKTNSP